MSVDANALALGERIPAGHAGHARPPRIALAACGWLTLLAFAVALAVALGRAPIPLGITIGGGVFVAVGMALVVGRYDLAVVVGFALSCVVIVEPAPSDVLFGLAIVVAALTGRFSLRRVPRMAIWLVASLLVLNVISAIDVLSWSVAARFFLITFYLCLFSLWLAAYIDRPERARSLVCAYLAAAVFSAVVGSAALFIHYPGHTLMLGDDAARAKALFKDPNVYGPFLIPITLILLEEIMRPRLLRLRRSWMIGCFLVLVLGVLFSYSRAAWLSLVIGVIVLMSVVAFRRLDRRVISLLLVMLIAGVAIGGAVAGTGSLHFLNERAKLQSYDTGRFAAQARGLKVGLDHPFGVGPGQFDLISPVAAQSLYIRVLSEQGPLALLVIAALVVGTIGMAWLNVVHGSDTYGISAAALLAAWCGLLANSLFVDTLHWRYLWLVAALIWAGAMRRRSAERSARSDPSRLRGGGLPVTIG